MTIRAMVMGAIVTAVAFAGGALGNSPEAALGAATLALVAWAIVRFLHWRSELRRIDAGRAAGPHGRSAEI